MGALQEIREAEIRLDMTISPIEEAYTMLNKYNLSFNDGNAERVDQLSYSWKLLKALVLQTQDHLIAIQPQFKGDLLVGVDNFKVNAVDFEDDYDKQ